MLLLPPIVTPDSTVRYERVARNLLEGHGFSWALTEPYEPDRLNQPGYPVFVAAIYFIAGEQRTTVVFVQILLELITVLMILRIARRADLSPLARAIVAAIALLCPILPVLTRAIWTETLATTALTATTLACVAASGGTVLAPWILAGVGIGISLLIRPDMTITVALLGMTLVRITAQRAFIRCFVVAAISCVVVLAPWTIHNYMRFGSPNPLGASTDYLSRPYLSWLGTWVDDVSQMAPYLWHGLEPTSPSTYPADKVIDAEERARAEAALAEARAAHSFRTPAARKTFEELTAKARHDRPFRTFVVIPARRLISTWLNLVAAYTSSLWVRAGWILFLLCAMAGALWGLRNRPRITALLLAIVAGRSTLPLIFGIGVEPRYLAEALPEVFIFFGFLFQAMVAKATPSMRSNDTTATGGAV